MLAQRVGYLCSNPACQAPTIGPKTGEQGIQNVGVAAHIKAAARGFARYDEDQTPAERAGFDNGIWLCQTHSKLIDHDVNTFTVELLHQWKREAEQRAFQQLKEGRGPARVYEPGLQLVEEFADLKRRLILPEEVGLESVRYNLTKGARIQIEAFEGSPRWPRRAVELELVSIGERDPSPFSLQRFSDVLRAIQRVALVSSPGAGKSTIMVQIARSMLDFGPVPALVPLAEWGEAALDLLSWLGSRRGYEALSANHFKFLAHHGELALLLDGYNELPAHTRLRLIRELEGLQRDFPLLNVVLSSRPEARALPIDGRRFGVMPLSDGQQIDIASALRGEEGISIRDHAWRTKGIGDLVSNPLYLRALMETAGNSLPETKEEVIAGFVATHESEAGHAELFHAQLHGEHRRYLVALAIAAQESGSPTLAVGDAARAVGAVNRKLAEDGIVPAPPSAQNVLDTLVAAHSLVRESETTITFQHHQLQEWFASLQLDAELMAASGELTISHPLVTGYLNDASWGEVVLFACERMSRRNADSAGVVGQLVRVMLGVGPRFAAQIVARSSSLVWQDVGQDIIEFASRWHGISEERAVGFMIESQRAEFADVIWPLVTNAEDQVQMNTMRQVQRFNPKVLGEKLTLDYSCLPDRRREILLSELASHGDRAGMDLAHRLALTEPSTRIRQAVFDGLSFRRATHLMEDLLRKSGEPLMDAVARRGHFDEIKEDALRADLNARRSHLIESGGSPEDRVAMALISYSGEELARTVRSSITEEAFSMRDRGMQLVYDAWCRVPVAVAEALRARTLNGLELPFRLNEYLDQVPISDEPLLASRILDHDLAKPEMEPLLYLAGPSIVAELLHRFLVAHRSFEAEGKRSSTAYRPVELLVKALKATRADVLFEAIQVFDERLSSSDIGALSYVISGHGQNSHREKIILDGARRDCALAILTGWAKRLLVEPADRRDMAALTWAMRRLPDPSLVPHIDHMLRYELAERRKLRAAYEADKRNKAALNGWQHSNQNQYRSLLTTIGTHEAHDVLAARLSDPDFGLEAALGMQAIWQKMNEPQPTERFGFRYPDFEKVIVNRARGWSTVSETAVLLMQEARRSATIDTQANRNRAAAIAGSAVLLPHGEESSFFLGLLQGDIAHLPRLNLARRMVAGGYVLSSEIILSSISSVIARQHPDWRLLNDNDGRELFDWLALLPASDDPASLLKGIELMLALNVSKPQLLPEFRGLRLLSEPDRIAIMRSIVDLWPEFIEQHEFYDMLHDPSEATLDLLSDVMGGSLGAGSPSRGMRYDFAERFYRLLSQKERNGLMRRYEASSNDRVRAFLGRMLLSNGDHSTFLAFAATVVGRRLIEQRQYHLRGMLLYTKYPHEDAAVYESVPRDINKLRKGLFELALTENKEASIFARQYLDGIDAARESEGFIEIGQLHPHIGTGRPWPILDASLEV